MKINMTDDMINVKLGVGRVILPVAERQPLGKLRKPDYMIDDDRHD